MEIDSILGFLENKSILVTGGAGFLAKIFVEKVLRIQPNVKKIYILIRASDNKSASLRLQNEVIGKELFKVLKQKMGANFNSFISEKVKVVVGDLNYKELGIKDNSLRDELLRDIHVIVNLAATTNFDERYDVSLNLNTLGARHTLNFAKKCRNLKVLLQVSTAYVSGERGGLIEESPYHMGDTLNGREGLDIDFEKKLCDAKLLDLQHVGATQETIKLAMKDMGLERSRHWGWPNVYVFTKALGEMILMQENGDNIPLVILRPTIVSSTFKEPFPGWVEGIRTIDSLVVAYGRGRLPCFLGDPESVVDVIPADMVVNAMIVAMEAQANLKGETKIYHVGSSVRNPVKLAVMHEAAYHYYRKHPRINKDGNPIIINHCKVMSSMSSFKRYLTFRYVLPLKGLEIANIAFCKYFQGTYTEMTRKINVIMRLIDIYRPYLFFKGYYDDLNTEKLRNEAGERGLETDIFYFDAKVFEWEDYFINVHFPGIVKYVCK